MIKIKVIIQMHLIIIKVLFNLFTKTNLKIIQIKLIKHMMASF